MGGLANNLHGAARVRNARQLHLNAVVRLLANIGLGNAKLVNTVADGTQGLIERKVFDALDFCRAKAGHITQLSGFTGLGFAHVQLRKVLGQQFTELGLVFRTRQHEFKSSATHHAGAQHHNLFVFGNAAQILAHQGQRIAHSLGHVYTERQMDAALEVKAEIDFARRQDALKSCSQIGNAGQRVNKGQHKNHDGYGQAPEQTHRSPSTQQIKLCRNPTAAPKGAAAGHRQSRKLRRPGYPGASRGKSPRADLATAGSAHGPCTAPATAMAGACRQGRPTSFLPWRPWYP